MSYSTCKVVLKKTFREKNFMKILSTERLPWLKKFDLFCKYRVNLVNNII